MHSYWLIILQQHGYLQVLPSKSKHYEPRMKMNNYGLSHNQAISHNLLIGHLHFWQLAGELYCASEKINS